jgi:hypothetical protein
MFPLNHSVGSVDMMEENDERLSDPQMLMRGISPTAEQQRSSPSIRMNSEPQAHQHLPNSSVSKLLYKPTSSISFQGSGAAPHWIRILEVFSGFGILNLLLLLILYSPPSSLEAWLFAGAINLLVSFAVLVRIEQLGIDPGHSVVPHGGSLSALSGGGGMSSLLRGPGSWANLKTSSSEQTTTRGQQQQLQDQQKYYNGATDDSDDDGVEEAVTQVDNPTEHDEALMVVGSTGNRAGQKPRQQGGITGNRQRYAMSTNLKSVIFPRDTNSTSTHSMDGGDSPEATMPATAVKAPNHTYNAIDASTMHVRTGPNYRKEGKKVPSETALMNLVGCDLYYSEEKLDFVAEKVLFPEPTPNSFISLEESSGEKASRYRPLPGDLPHFFVFNIQLQKAGATGIFGSRGGSGYSLVCYFEPSEEFLRDVASTGSTSPAAKLVQKWFTTYHDDQAMHDRLKLKATVLNKSTCDLSPWVLRYNGKPAMITKSNTMSRVQCRTQQGRLCEAVECDVDLRVWNLLFRQGLNSVLPSVGKLSFALAFVIEGETDDELPERVLAGIQLNYLDIVNVNHW